MTDYTPKYKCGSCCKQVSEFMGCDCGATLIWDTIYERYKDACEERMRKNPRDNSPLPVWVPVTPGRIV